MFEDYDAVREGRLKEFPKFRPNIPNTIFIIIYARKAITSPIKAATMIFLALSTPALSPPDVIHLIPPYTRNARAKSDAKIKASVISVWNRSPPNVILHNFSNPPPVVESGQSCTVAAKALLAATKYVVNVSIRTDIFFIYILIVETFLFFVKKQNYFC